MRHFVKDRSDSHHQPCGSWDFHMRWAVGCVVQACLLVPPVEGELFVPVTTYASESGRCLVGSAVTSTSDFGQKAEPAVEPVAAPRTCPLMVRCGKCPAVPVSDIGSVLVICQSSPDTPADPLVEVPATSR